MTVFKSQEARRQQALQASRRGCGRSADRAQAQVEQARAAIEQDKVAAQAGLEAESGKLAAEIIRTVSATGEQAPAGGQLIRCACVAWSLGDSPRPSSCRSVRVFACRSFLAAQLEAARAQGASVHPRVQNARQMSGRAGEGIARSSRRGRRTRPVQALRPRCKLVAKLTGPESGRMLTGCACCSISR